MSMPVTMPATILAVAESDSSGASGLQADVKAATALGGHAMTSVTAVAAQNAHGLAHLQMLEPWFVAQQMTISLDGANACAIKTGLLFKKDVIDAVADVIDGLREKPPLVVDPCLAIRRGGELMDSEGIATLKRRLFVRAAVLTPSLWEAELLTGLSIRTLDDVRHAAEMMRTLGAEAVLLKAGDITNAGRTHTLLATAAGEHVFEWPVAASLSTPAAGATLGAGLAVSLAQGMDILSATVRALGHLHETLAPGTCGEDSSRITTLSRKA